MRVVCCVLRGVVTFEAERAMPPKLYLAIPTGAADTTTYAARNTQHFYLSQGNAKVGVFA